MSKRSYSQEELQNLYCMINCHIRIENIEDGVGDVSYVGLGQNIDFILGHNRDTDGLGAGEWHELTHA